MIRKLSVLCAAIALVATAPAHAQSKGTFLVEVGAGLPFYASQLGLDSKVGFGGRLGYMLSDKIGIEADAFYYSTEPSSLSYTGVTVTQTPIHGRFTYNAPMGKGLAAIFGLGYAYNMWGEDADAYFLNTEGSDGGPGGLFGLRFGAGGKVSARVDVTGDYIMNPVDETLSGDDSRFALRVRRVHSLLLGDVVRKVCVDPLQHRSFLLAVTFAAGRWRCRNRVKEADPRPTCRTLFGHAAPGRRRSGSIISRVYSSSSAHGRAMRIAPWIQREPKCSERTPASSRISIDVAMRSGLAPGRPKGGLRPLGGRRTK